jgi:hypothetical protein
VNPGRDGFNCVLSASSAASAPSSVTTLTTLTEYRPFYRFLVRYVCFAFNAL